ncbi:hypothetical protein A2U01_0100545, partial [Trifolium medium]|nr:hypothetical protein [Trifolium medium]
VTRAARSSVVVVPVFFCQLRGAQGCPALRADLVVGVDVGQFASARIIVK